MANRIVTLDENPNLLDRIKENEGGAFPEFLLRDPAWDECWPHMIGDFAHLQIFMLDDSDTLLAILNSVPINWDGTADSLGGFQDTLLRAIREYKEGIKPNTLCGVQAMTTEAAKGKGLSGDLMKASAATARKYDLTSKISPIRATLKDRYPLTPFENYIKWKRDDGLPFDPWLRVQERQAAKFIKISDPSTVIRGTVAEWEEWTDMAFPESGTYIIPGGQVPVSIDREKDEGLYEEPHAWYRFDL